LKLFVFEFTDRVILDMTFEFHCLIRSWTRCRCYSQCHRSPAWGCRSLPLHCCVFAVQHWL